MALARARRNILLFGRDKGGFVALIHPAFQPHFTEHHLWSLDEILIDLNDFAFGIGVRSRVQPRDTLRGFTRLAFLEKQNVRGDFGVGVSFEGIVGQPDCAQKFGAVANVFAERRVGLVHRAARRDEHDQAARSDFFQSRREEIIVDQKSMLIEFGVKRFVVTKRDIGNGEIEEFVGKLAISQKAGCGCPRRDKAPWRFGPSAGQSQPR